MKSRRLKGREREAKRKLRCNTSLGKIEEKMAELSLGGSDQKRSGGEKIPTSERKGGGRSIGIRSKKSVRGGQFTR